MRDKTGELGKSLKRDNVKKMREIRMKRKEEQKFTLPPVLKRNESAKIFLEEYESEFKPGGMQGPVVVGGNHHLLSKDEVAVLSRGPNFTIRRILYTQKASHLA